jgi:DNA polymerase-1
MTNRKTLVLIDGHALAYRVFYALPMESFTTRGGEPTNATYGFARTLLDLITAEIPPTYLAVSFDRGMTFRDQIFPAYKGTRDKMPGELGIQIERIRQLLDAFNTPVLEADGYEADDVLGTVARMAAGQGVETLIVTGDRDLLQLVDQHTRVQLPGRRLGEAQIYDVEAVHAQYGLEPEQIVDLKALTGDKSDNIPGVAGVGEKTATQLLQTYGTVEGVYQHLDEVQSTRFRNALGAGREDALLSRDLARIVTDVPVEFDLEACRTQDYDREAVADLFRALEFRSLIGRLPGGDRPPTEASPHQLALFAEEPRPPADGSTRTYLVLNQADLDALVELLAAAPAITFDVETTSTDQMRADLVGIALSVAEGEGYYIPVGHRDLVDRQLPLDVVLERLRPALTDPGIPKYGHNVKYDAVVMARHGLTPTPLAFDTMIAEWLCDPASHNKGLKDLAWMRLNVEMTPIEDLIGKGAKQISMAEVAAEAASRYAAADADMTHRLVAPLHAEMQQKRVWDLFIEIEMPLVPVLADIEQAGVLIDTDLLKRMSQELGERLAELEQAICDHVGYPFNVNSTQQLSDALFKSLGLPTEGLRKTDSGHYSTAANVLETLRNEHEVVRLVLEQRELSKLKSTYLDALPQLVNPQTGRVHTSFNQTGTVTGRISSSDPNLQNIPIRTEQGRRVRDAFIAAPGNVLVGADYSQIELRVLAHISGDPGLLQAFHEGQDIHASTAAVVYGIPIEQVTLEQRNFAKRVNFGLLYGMGAFRLARESDLTLSEAGEFVTAYFERFPRVRGYFEETKRRAAENGYVETLLKRRRYFSVLQSRDTSRATQMSRRAAEREAINMPIQGTAADIIKIAMTRLQAALGEHGLHGQMILQVHDELVLEAPEDEAEATARLVSEIMENAYLLDAPLRADTRTGHNWGELK